MILRSAWPSPDIAVGPLDVNFWVTLGPSNEMGELGWKHLNFGLVDMRKPYKQQPSKVQRVWFQLGGLAQPHEQTAS